MNKENSKIREASIEDTEQIQFVRQSVRENRLTRPHLVTDQHVREYLTERGKGWVCEVRDQICGFAIADLKENNIWALFIHPEFEKKGIGRQLQKIMLDWYFEQGKKEVWLSTSPQTRAEQFYRQSGWQETGLHGKDEIRFEMTRERWLSLF